MSVSLKSSVYNSAATESNDSIKEKAGQVYYSQNRMITAEDYQIAPLTSSQEIIKVKSVNRVSSGISRYLDLVDATGRYSKTNLFATDGILTREYLDTKEGFDFVTKTDIEGVLANIIEPILNNRKVKNYYLTKFGLLLYGYLLCFYQAKLEPLFFKFIFILLIKLI